MEIVQLSLLTVDAIPEDADGIIIHSPSSDISTEEKDMLADYVAEGKPDDFSFITAFNRNRHGEWSVNISLFLLKLCPRKPYITICIPTVRPVPTGMLIAVPGLRGHS